MKRTAFIWQAALLGLLILPAGAQGIVITYRDGLTTPFVGGSYTGTQDTFIRGIPTTTTFNFGGRDSMVVGGTGDASNHTPDLRRALLRFDVTSSANQFSSISSVTLRLTYFNNGQGTAPLMLEAYEIAAPNSGWVEGTGTGSGSTILGTSSWSFRVQGTTSWTGGVGLGAPGGGGFSATPFDSVTYNPTLPTTLSTVDLEIPGSLFQSWTTGTNPGILLRIPGVDDSVAFYTSEATTAIYRPTLFIDGVLVPEPGTWVLTIVGLTICGGGIRARCRRPQGAVV